MGARNGTPSGALLALAMILAAVSPTGCSRHHRAKMDPQHVNIFQDMDSAASAINPALQNTHTGWLYHENLAPKYPSMFLSSGRVTNRQTGVIGAMRSDQRFSDGSPILYPAANGHQAAVCLSEKAGSSRWKMILLKAQTGNFTLEIHRTETSWLHGMSREQQIKEIEAPETLRMMFVRNPYARLLSGFLDKGCHPNPGQWEDLINGEYGGPYEDTPEEFARFVRHLMAMRAQGQNINGHFSPLVEHCGVSSGMRYDLYLKAEEMDEWYPDVATFLGLTEAAKSGFDTRDDPRAEDDAEILDCFYPLTGSTCTETSAYLERYREDSGIPRPGNSDAPAAWQAVQNTRHSHGADGLIGQYYTQHVAELAYLMLQMDLNAFGYPKLEFP